MFFRNVLKLFCSRGQSVILKEWLRDPKTSLIPNIENLTVVEVSKILSTITIKKLDPPSKHFWTSIIAKLFSESRSLTSSSFVSSLHILDRLAFFGIVDLGTDSLIERLGSVNHRISPTDAFIGARAVLLLGSTEIIPFCTRSHLKAMSPSNLALLGALGMSCDNQPFTSLVSSVMTDIFRESKNLNSISTFDLISSVKILSRYKSKREVSSILKSCGTELVRRIELGFVSPHSCVDLVEMFSGTPPAPIHPILLQACFAFLLENWNYKALCRDEIAKIVHASVLCEIENTVLTPILVREFSCQFVSSNHKEDPRISLRMMAAVSLSKSTIDSALIHTISRQVAIRDGIKSIEDASILATAFLNSLYSGICLEQVNEFLSSRLVDQLIRAGDLNDLATISLLASASRDMVCFIHPHQHDDSRALPFIPPEALEITGKANPAMPRNDLKKKRLAKRIAARGSSMFKPHNNELDVMDDKREVCFETNTQDMGGVVLKSIVHSLNLLDRSNGESALVSIEENEQSSSPSFSMAEHRDGAHDIVSSLLMCCDEVLSSAASMEDLKSISLITEVCLEILKKHPAKLLMESRDGMEESVRTSLGARSATRVTWPIRISLVLDN